ncbi:MAG TPA: toprim domain-containing protein, partial [Symbiobacteriaceae bacterium]|nr:toprim domain-containing protein [Symbiobacteriaceae bacterium]
RRVPYRLPDLIAAVRNGGDAVFLVEGEKDADALWRLGVPATTNLGGAGKWGQAETQALQALPGRPTYVILPDNDLAGARHAAEVRFQLRQARLDARVVELPGLPPKGDVSDWLGMGHTAQQLRALSGLGLVSRR